MTLKREIKDAYIEKGAPIYVKTHSNAVYVDDNETETLTQRLDDIKGKIDNNTSQLDTIMINKVERRNKLNYKTVSITVKPNLMPLDSDCLKLKEQGIDYEDK